MKRLNIKKRLQNDKKKVAAVVVTYNRKNLLLECIDALFAQTCKKQLDVIVVDNASTDGTQDALKHFVRQHKITYVNTGANLGGAGGFQRGIEYASNKDYDYIWVMDDDCIPTKNALDEFLKCARSLGDNFGFLSSKALWKDGTLCRMNVQRRTLTKDVRKIRKKPVEVAMASFVSLFIPVKIVHELGLPIKEFFIWTDDWEYTRRISRKHKCYLVPESIVVHKSANNGGANVVHDGADRLDRYRYIFRNDIYLYRREGVKGFAFQTAKILYYSASVLLFSKNNKTKRLKSIFSGTIDGFKFKPSIEYAKRKTK